MINLKTPCKGSKVDPTIGIAVVIYIVINLKTPCKGSKDEFTKDSG